MCDFAEELLVLRNVARARRGDDFAVLVELLDALPAGHHHYRIGPGDEIKAGALPKLLMEMLESIERVARRLAVDLEAGDVEVGIGRCRQLDHGKAVESGCQLTLVFFAGFERVVVSGYEYYALKIELAVRFLGGDEVAVVDGIKRPAHNADSARPLGHCGYCSSYQLSVVSR